MTPDGVVLTGTCGRGAARSDDGGRTWQPLDLDVGNADVNAFRVTRDRWFAAAGDAGLFESAHGASWRRVAMPHRVVYSVLELPTELLVGTGSGLLAGRGDHWTPVDPGPTSAVYRLIALPQGRMAAATESDGVWIGDDARWQPAGADRWPVYALAAPGSGALVAGTRGGGVLHSADGGRTWEAAGGLPDPVVHCLVEEPDGAVLAGTGLGIARSRDGGRSWAPLGDGLRDHRIFSLALDPDGGILAGSYEGIWRQAPGASTWTALDTGLSVGEAFTVTCGAENRAWAGVRGGAFASVDAGRSWRACHAGIDGGTTYAICVLTGSDGRRTGDVLAGTDDGVRRFDHDADRWQPAGLRGMRAFALLEPRPGLLLAGTLGHGVHRCAGGGAWEASRDGLPFRNAFGLLAARSGDLFVAAGDVADGVKTGGILRSTDEGRSWRPTRHAPVAVYAVAESSDGVLIAGAQRSCILRSTDGGASWEATRPAGYDDSKLYSLMFTTDDRLFLGTGARLLRSDDLAQSWLVVGGGLDGVSVYGLAEDDTGALLAATTSGMFRSCDHGMSFEPTPWPGDGGSPTNPPSRVGRR